MNKDIIKPNDFCVSGTNESNKLLFKLLTDIITDTANGNNDSGRVIDRDNIEIDIIFEKGMIILFEYISYDRTDIIRTIKV